MRPFLLSLLLVTTAAHAETQSALEALKVLPKGALKNLARIEAREGTPAPERWHFLVYDPAAPHGLREYVVVGKQIVASQAISQFAESLQLTDVIGGAMVKMDSGKLADLAQKYALANHVRVASINYEMHKEGEVAAPLWAVTCLAENGDELGALLVSARDGKMIAHTGFLLVPATAPLSESESEAEMRRRDAELLTAPSPATTQAATASREEPEATGAEPSNEPVADEDDGGEPNSRRVVEKHTHHSEASGPSVPTVVRRITSPVRRIVRGLWPF